MCKYCDPDSCENLITNRFSISFFNNETNAFVDVFITSEGELEVYADYYDDTIVKKTTPIKYCPMCGRKLSQN